LQADYQLIPATTAVTFLFTLGEGLKLHRLLKAHILANIYSSKVVKLWKELVTSKGESLGLTGRAGDEFILHSIFL